MSDKPFKSIEEQIALLESRGMTTDDRTPSILLREGYYQVVNGYKDPFIDEEATRSAGDDRYKEGTSFTDLYSLFRFDRDLRELTFHYLVRVEAVVRTIVSYTFAEAHPGIDDYLDSDNFATEEQYSAFGLDKYRRNMHILQSTLFKKADSNERESIRHYRERYGGVPIWVLANDLTFGNVEHFFNLMKPEEQALFCRRVVEVTGRIGSDYGFFDTQEARVGLNLIVKMRNMCAHDERLYCAKIGDRQSASYTRVISYASRYLPEKEFQSLVRDMVDAVTKYSSKSAPVGHVLRKMGFEDDAERIAEGIKARKR